MDHHLVPATDSRARAAANRHDDGEYAFFNFDRDPEDRGEISDPHTVHAGSDRLSDPGGKNGRTAGDPAKPGFDRMANWRYDKGKFAEACRWKRKRFWA
jgi:hypothetical protein